MSSLYLLIGGNQGDRKALLQQATDLIRQRVGSVVGCSQLYETAPWGTFDGMETQPFLNMALQVETSLSAHDCLRECLAIEKELGRQRKGNTPPNDAKRVYSSRPIDIDLILFDNEVISLPDLTIPHPRMHQRRFVLQPLCDIAPDAIHPVLKKTISQLLSICEDNCSCSVYCSAL
ncbi:MAG: 2-amino-4-hydroxy-6-hydroxymethyldihydropteridine diphosphokinase [Bacteroidales bacterium]|nr:2-amino-4-hydroxy-6-hydroxymethyldihydropteridine diphosphokinase [Bacteroidales bacterium]